MIYDHPIIFIALLVAIGAIVFLAWSLCRRAALCDEQDGYEPVADQLWGDEPRHPTGIGA